MNRLRTLMWLVLTTAGLAGCAQEPALTQAGDVNLAGCEVPAGLTREEAERIECTQGNPIAADITPPSAAPETEASTASAGQD